MFLPREDDEEEYDRDYEVKGTLTFLQNIRTGKIAVLLFPACLKMKMCFMSCLF